MRGRVLFLFLSSIVRSPRDATQRPPAELVTARMLYP